VRKSHRGVQAAGELIVRTSTRTTAVTLFALTVLVYLLTAPGHLQAGDMRAELAVAHLIEDQRAAGIKQPRIGIITGRSGVSTTEDRLTGYRQALQRHGLPYPAELVEVGHSSVEGGEVAARLLLRREPSGMFITNNQMTIGAVQVLRLQGKQWPEPLGLVGFDDGDYARLIMPELTVVSQPTALLGKRAARLLLDLVTDLRRLAQPRGAEWGCDRGSSTSARMTPWGSSKSPSTLRSRNWATRWVAAKPAARAHASRQARFGAQKVCPSFRPTNRARGARRPRRSGSIVVAMIACPRVTRRMA